MNLLISLSMTILMNVCQFQTHDSDFIQISEAVHSFVKAVDKQNTEATAKILHKDFRAIVNQAFGSDKVDILNKTTYLDLMKKGVIGGDERSVLITSIDMVGNNATVKAIFTGKDLVFETFVQLVKNTNGEWRIISDLPTIEKIKK